MLTPLLKSPFNWVKNLVKNLHFRSSGTLVADGSEPALERHFPLFRLQASSVSMLQEARAALAKEGGGHNIRPDINNSEKSIAKIWRC